MLSAAVVTIEILRLRNCFAKRSSCYAQDDRGLGFNGDSAKSQELKARSKKSQKPEALYSTVTDLARFLG